MALSRTQAVCALVGTNEEMIVGYEMALRDLLSLGLMPIAPRRSIIISKNLPHQLTIANWLRIKQEKQTAGAGDI